MADVKNQPVVIGIDLGGTNVRAGVVTPAGELLAWQDAPIEPERGPDAGVGKISNLVNAVLAEAGPVRLAGVGVGATGPIDRQRGAIINPYTLPTWEDVDIIRPLSERFRVPAVLENDADAAALGESWVGAGRGLKRMLMVTIGTGVGFAFVLDGHIYRGLDGWHPEGGHIPIDPSGPECYCGARGCWESLVAGPFIARRVQAAVRANPATAMLSLANGQIESIDSRILAGAARQGDPLAVSLVQAVGRDLGLGLVVVAHLFLPEGIVLSGGVMNAFDLFTPAVEEVIRRHSIVSPIRQVKIALSELEGTAGVLGAARAVMIEYSL